MVQKPFERSELEFDEGTLQDAVDTHIQWVVEDIWDSFLGEEIIKTPEVDISGEKLYTGLVEFSGTWKGLVTIEATDALSRVIASKMFQKPTTEVKIEDMLDCLGELANIVGGYIRAILPKDCWHSMPAVVTGLMHRIIFDDAELINELYFSCQDEAMIVRLFKGSSPY